MQSHTNTSRVGRRCRLLAVAALTLTLFSGVCVKNTAMASADGPDVISGASGLLSQTSYRSVPVGVDSYDYWTEQATAPDRVQYVADPAGKRGTVQRIEVQPGDRSGEGERAEVLNLSDLGGFQDGETIVMSWGVMIDSTFASPLGTWNSFVQIHADGGGNQSPLYLSLAGDEAELFLHLFGGGDWTPKGQPDGSVSESLDLGPLPKDRWHDFVMSVRFGCTGSGYVQLWLDGHILVDARDRKIGYCGDRGMYWKQGFYRAAYDKTTLLWFSDTAMTRLDRNPR